MMYSNVIVMSNSVMGPSIWYLLIQVYTLLIHYLHIPSVSFITQKRRKTVLIYNTSFNLLPNAGING